MVAKEGRFSRWSRLKQQEDRNHSDPNLELPGGGAGPSRLRASENQMDRENELALAPDPARLPGGDFRHNNIPLMAPLAGFENDGTGIESVPPDVLRMLESKAATDGDVIAKFQADDDAPSDEIAHELTEDEQQLVDALPPLSSLTRESDFTPFLADKVPGFIRRRALSVLWRSDPILANLDGMNDYDEDFNVINTLINAVTDSDYQVGKGMRQHSEANDEENEATSLADAGEPQTNADEAGVGEHSTPQKDNDKLEAAESDRGLETASPQSEANSYANVVNKDKTDV